VVWHVRYASPMGQRRRQVEVDRCNKWPLAYGGWAGHDGHSRFGSFYVHGAAGAARKRPLGAQRPSLAGTSCRLPIVADADGRSRSIAAISAPHALGAVQRVVDSFQWCSLESPTSPSCLNCPRGTERPRSFSTVHMSPSGASTQTAHESRIRRAGAPQCLHIAWM